MSRLEGHSLWDLALIAPGSASNYLLLSASYGYLVIFNDYIEIDIIELYLKLFFIVFR